ncbi:MAG: SDR family oxidoreductase [Halieaceae bacterium]|jgi:short-subunit dehydrogenase|nr:SDR family oxidoreductase [Halieaceae bacterium]MBT6123674.1 SDR family oxidoreductase [Halieaceae bacterium]MBT7720600.1 SDR family oxidoreductase [Halieaceae bacterium]
MNISGKSLLLTGATGGIGTAMAHRLAGEGARLILVSRNQHRLDNLLARLPGEGHTVVSADIGTAEGRQTIVSACQGQLDGLINNAGINSFGMLETLDERQLQQMFEINAMAPILLTRDLLYTLSKSAGFVVNVGSGFGSIGFPGYCAYSASKFALRGFTEALRRELADTAVSVLYFAPRATDTAMNPPEVVELNKELGNTTDSPKLVADELFALVKKGKGNRAIGLPERFFARLNALFPSLVDGALAKQLPTIRRRALAGTEQRT